MTEIKTNIFVTSFGPVSDTEMVRDYWLIQFNLQIYKCLNITVLYKCCKMDCYMYYYITMNIFLLLYICMTHLLYIYVTELFSCRNTPLTSFFVRAGKMNDFASKAQWRCFPWIIFWPVISGHLTLSSLMGKSLSHTTWQHLTSFCG